MKNSATGFLLHEENRIIENAMKFWGCSSKIEAPSRLFVFMHSCQVHLRCLFLIIKLLTSSAITSLAMERE